MLTKICLMAALAAIVISSASVSFAGPNDRVPEPTYFQHATGDLG